MASTSMATRSFRRLVSKRVTFVSSEDYARVPTTDELDLNGVPFSRTGARRNAFSGQVDARLTKFIDLSVKYDNTWVRFDRTRHAADRRLRQRRSTPR